MDQWIHVRSRYLHLLLEMEGVTKAPRCSLCKEAMAVKCGDCIGGNYFCVACCLQSHKRSPFHRIFHWTGAHLSPISLYKLGFMLCLEHDGEPCPLTVDVRCYTVLPFELYSPRTREFAQPRNPFQQSKHAWQNLQLRVSRANCPSP